MATSPRTADSRHRWSARRAARHTANLAETGGRHTAAGAHAPYALAGVVALLTGLVYLRSLQNDFVNWDDHVYVFENPNIRVFDRHLFRWAFLGFHEGNWHPLTWISHALDYALWGLNPLGHHLTNTILHAVNASLVVVLVARLVEAATTPAECSPASPVRVPRFTLVVAVTTGLLFGLHPVHVESVAWVAERKDVLCAFFFLLSLVMYGNYAGAANRDGPAHAPAGPTRGAPRSARGVNRYYLAALACFALALLSKPMAVSLPAVLLILDWYPFRRLRSLTQKKGDSPFFTERGPVPIFQRTVGRLQSFTQCWPVLVEKIPMVVLSLVSSVLTVLAQEQEGALGVITPPVAMRVLVAAKSLIAYLYKMAVPVYFSPVYPYPKDASIASVPYLLASAAVIGMTIGCAVAARRQRLWLSVWGYYVITLLPAIGIVQVGSQAMADRYTYLPSLAPFLLAGLGVARMEAYVRAATTRRRLVRLGAVCVAILGVAGMSFATIRQIGVWEDGMTLWSHVIANQPNEAVKAYINRGVLFQVAGDLDKALADFNRAIALNPGRPGNYLKPSVYYEAYLRRGQTLESQGERSKALADFDAVSELDPSYGPAYRNRAGLFERAGQVDRAIAELDKAIAANPGDQGMYIERGILYGKYRSLEAAIDQFSVVIRANPSEAPAFGNRGWAYALLGQHERGLADLNRAIELNPGYAIAYFYRGHVSLRGGQSVLAGADFQKACVLGEKAGCDALKSLGEENSRRP